LPGSPELFQILISRAEGNFGRQRADELRPDIEQVASDLAELSAEMVEFTDEP
jgi:hypothetical protein